MSKALLGAHTDARSLALLDEVRQLRRRVAELEAALEEADVAAGAATERAASAGRRPQLQPTV